MKNNTGNSIKVGVFVAIAATMLIVALYYIGVDRQMFNQTFRISGIFRDVNGLQVGNNVRLSGINVGTIENVEIVSDTAVKVDIVIDDDVRKFIKKDAEAVIGSDGLMGNKILIIIPGTNSKEEIQDNDVIKTVEPINMEGIMGKIRNTTENVMTISDDLAAIMNNIRSGNGTIGKLLMDTAMGEELNQSIVNIKEGTGGFKKNMDAAKKSIFLRPFLKDKDKEKEKEKKEKKMEEMEKTKTDKKNKKEGWFNKKKTVEQ